MIPLEVWPIGSSNVFCDHPANHKYLTLIDVAPGQYYGMNMQADMDVAASFSSQEASSSSRALQPQDLWGGPLLQNLYDYNELQLVFSLDFDKNNPSHQLGNLPQPNIPSCSADIASSSTDVPSTYESPQKRQKSLEFREEVALEIAKVEWLLRKYIRQKDSDHSDSFSDDNIEKPIHRYDLLLILDF